MPNKKSQTTNDETKPQWDINQVVWAKMAGYPHWPAVVVDPAKAPSDVVDTVHSKKHTLVRFFGDGTYAWLSEILLFKDNFERFSKSRNKSLPNAIRLAEEFEKTGVFPETEEKDTKKRKRTSQSSENTPKKSKVSEDENEVTEAEEQKETEEVGDRTIANGEAEEIKPDAPIEESKEKDEVEEAKEEAIVEEAKEEDEVEEAKEETKVEGAKEEHKTEEVNEEPKEEKAEEKKGSEEKSEKAEEKKEESEEQKKPEEVGEGNKITTE